MYFEKKWFSKTLFLILLVGLLSIGIMIRIWEDENNLNFISLNIPKSAQAGTITPGEVVMGTTDGYNWWSYVPESLQKSDTAYILVEMSHAGSENYATVTNDARQNVENWISLADLRKYIIVTAALPRNFSTGYYPQGINVHSLNSSTPEFYYRPDLKVNNIISELIGNLTDAGYNPHDKIFVAGFSAGGMWANRYTLLHPERVLGAAMGQAGGWLAMPISEYNGSTLNWPMGINNFDILTSASYNKTEFLKEVPQFIYIGSLDTSSTYCNEGYPYCDNITIWGATDPERLETQYTFLKEHNYIVQFKLYESVCHDYNILMKNDILNFFDTIRREDTLAISGYNLLIFLPLILISSILITFIYSKKKKFLRVSEND